LLARSSVLAVMLAGCDFVFGVNGQPEPCELRSFGGATRTEIVEAEEFSVDWDQTFAVFSQGGLNWQMKLPDGTPEMIDLGVYVNLTFALAPEGTSLFFTAAIEPPTLRGALRDASTWAISAEVPRGTYAGTPSADAFGPRRVLVRLRYELDEIQEYEDDSGHWVAVGQPITVRTQTAPNLTPNGLTMVYSALEPELGPGVYAQSRTSVDEPFGAPVLLREGKARAAQLCGRCQQLYVVGDGEGSTLVRYDR